MDPVRLRKCQGLWCALPDTAPSPHLMHPSPLLRADFSRPDADILRPLQVLFCYEQFDELTLLHLREFDKKKLISVETDIVVDQYKEEKSEDGSSGQLPSCLGPGLACGLGGWGGGPRGLFIWGRLCSFISEVLTLHKRSFWEHLLFRSWDLFIPSGLVS